MLKPILFGDKNWAEQLLSQRPGKGVGFEDPATVAEDARRFAEELSAQLPSGRIRLGTDSYDGFVREEDAVTGVVYWQTPEGEKPFFLKAGLLPGAKQFDPAGSVVVREYARRIGDNILPVRALVMTAGTVVRAPWYASGVDEVRRHPVAADTGAILDRVRGIFSGVLEKGQAKRSMY